MSRDDSRRMGRLINLDTFRDNFEVLAELSPRHGLVKISLADGTEVGLPLSFEEGLRLEMFRHKRKRAKVRVRRVADPHPHYEFTLLPAECGTCKAAIDVVPIRRGGGPELCRTCAGHLDMTPERAAELLELQFDGGSLPYHPAMPSRGLLAIATSGRVVHARGVTRPEDAFLTAVQTTFGGVDRTHALHRISFGDYP